MGKIGDVLLEVPRKPGKLKRSADREGCFTEIIAALWLFGQLTGFTEVRNMLPRCSARNEASVA